MTRWEKIGKASWVVYLSAAAPVALFLMTMWIALLPLWMREDVGPVEDGPVPFFDELAAFAGLVAFPLVWLVSLVMASRFEERKFRFIPFLANLIPVAGLFRVSLLLIRDEGEDLRWVLLYPGSLAGLLVLGLAAVTVFPFRNDSGEVAAVR